jgi:hypothetical protein
VAEAVIHKLKVINVISREYFQVFLVTYLVLTLAETYREGFVSNFFNINYLLVVVLVSGVAMVLTEAEVTVKKFRKRVSKAVIILTIKEERKEFARKQRVIMEQRQLQLKHQQARTFTDIKRTATRMRGYELNNQNKLIKRNSDKTKRRIDGFF